MSAESRPLCGLLVVCLLGTLVVPVASAGDNIAILYFEGDDIEVAPGDTVTVDVVLSSHGGYGGDGVGEITFVLEYDTDTFSVVDIGHGEWLADGDDTEVVTSETHDETGGSLTVSHERDPPGSGATGTDTVLTLTLEVDAGAEPSEPTLEFTESSVGLVNGYPQTVVDRDGTLVVAGGMDDEPSDASGDEPGVTLAEPDDESETDAGATVDEFESEPRSENSTAADEDDGSDSTPGLSVLAGLVATLAVAVGLALLARRSSRP